MSSAEFSPFVSGDTIFTVPKVEYAEPEENSSESFESFMERVYVMGYTRGPFRTRKHYVHGYNRRV